MNGGDDVAYVRVADRCSSYLDGDIVIVIDGDEHFELAGAGPEVAAELRRLRDGSSRGEVRRRLGRRSGQELLDALEEAGLLRTSPLPRSAAIYERQLGLWDDLGDASAIQERLRASTVLVLGVGGIGAPVSRLMAASGVGVIVAVDGDRVAVDNLNRQAPFTLDDVGLSKPRALASHLVRLSSETRVVAVERFAEDGPTLGAMLAEHRPDLLIVAADRPPDVYGLALQEAATLGVANLGGAVGRTAGHWGPLLAPGLTACPRCAHDTLRLGDADRAAAAAQIAPMRASFGPTNALIADWIAHDAIRYLTGHAEGIPSLGCRRELSFSSGEAYASHDFPTCGHW